MLSLALKDFSKRARPFMPLCVCAALFCYFSVHFAGGEHGLEARDQLQLRVASLQTELSHLKRDRQMIEKRITLISRPEVHEDFIDEQARATLHYIHEDDLVVFE